MAAASTAESKQSPVVHNPKYNRDEIHMLNWKKPTDSQAKAWVKRAQANYGNDTGRGNLAAQINPKHTVEIKPIEVTQRWGPLIKDGRMNDTVGWIPAHGVFVNGKMHAALHHGSGMFGGGFTSNMKAEKASDSDEGKYWRHAGS